MIRFEKIRWKNLLSTGQQFTEIDLCDSDSTLIVGSNGAGKSTMLDALCFGLFNKPFRKINKPQLLNTINEKELVVEIEFKIGTIDYKVVRGLKPNVFEIYRNGELIDQDAATKDYQKYLEQSILKLNYKSFTQVVILGSSTFVPFMQLPAAHRREVIEDLLDIQIFSQMNTLLKERIKDVKDEQKQCEYELDLAQEKVNMQTRNIGNLEKVDKEHTQNAQLRFKENEDRVLEIRQRVKELDKEIEDITPKLVALDSSVEKHEKYKVMRTKISHRCEQSEKDLAFFNDNDTCPVCTQDIVRSFKETQIENLHGKIAELKTGREKITEEINKINTQVKELRQQAEVVNTYRYEIQSLTREEMKLLKENTKIMTDVGSDTVNLEEEKQELIRLEGKLSEKQVFCSSINKQHDNLKQVAGLLKDGGIKAKIISKFIPIINQRINKYLHSMDFYVNFTLDENFNEKILSRFRDDFSYASFSEGEKQKIDLALLFTWREVARMKNSVSTNLLILDEVFDSSLDQSATDELMKILKSFGSNTNLFVISHKGEVLLDKFSRILSFSKQGDFSNMTVLNG
ncbi:recombination endonuclease subunit [Synechococcus phage S-SZBM1]|uniref:Recombination endonuclease subunit n=1 Tax=Synechococcus phage S-SZBM1 TaxID=2926475 RepID=A0AC61TST1_9CAUD|nr:SbcC-like subunit of palindrome specific endonuclease [Synechococcus phage S-SZBM1]UNH61283.1 recombination endonuclease subunit [Synechococcus phage S-SZBM1]